MRAAMDDLASEDDRLFAAATYRVAPNKRHPDEQARLRKLGLLPLPGQSAKTEQDTQTGAAAALGGAEARRRARASAGARLHGLFPREMRVPTATPGRKGWPEFVAQQDPLA